MYPKHNRRVAQDKERDGFKFIYIVLGEMYTCVYVVKEQ